MARTLIRDVQLSRPAPRAAAKLPAGYGLMIGAAASVGLWFGLAKLVARVVG